MARCWTMRRSPTVRNCLGLLLQPRAEAEVALVLAHDLKGERPTLSELISSVAYVLPAIEIVESRIAGWDITIVDTIADNASAGLFVLDASPKLLPDIDRSEAHTSELKTLMRISYAVFCL